MARAGPMRSGGKSLPGNAGDLFVEKKKPCIIYLLGVSYSSSTLLGYFLGSHPQVFNAGELMLFPRKKKIRDLGCFCGKTVAACDFWKHLPLHAYQLYSKPGFKAKCKIAAALLLGRPVCRLVQNRPWDDRIFFDHLKQTLAQNDPGVQMVVDTSKSLFRLIYLTCTRQYDIKIIYIKRDILGNVASFIKSREGFLKGVVNYKLNHFFMPRFLKLYGLDYYDLSYKRLCLDPESELRDLGRFLGLDLSYDQVKDRLIKRTFHVFTGSTGRSQFKDFKGMRYDTSWTWRLNKIQQWILHRIALKSEQ
jgi:hypothetical protein